MVDSKLSGLLRVDFNGIDGGTSDCNLVAISN